MTWNLLPGAAEAAATPDQMDSLYEIVMAGGPIMIPLGICSVVALAYAVERAIRMRARRIGTPDFGRKVVEAVRAGGMEQGLRLCEADGSRLAQVVQAGLRESRHSFLHMEKAGEEAGSKEVRHLMTELRPFVIVAVIAPLLGLLGTVWGMIIAFMQIAYSGGLGKPEQLANGIAQALITTAAGLIIAIPTQALYYLFRGRVDRFMRLTEQTYAGLAEWVRSGERERAHS